MGIIIKSPGDIERMRCAGDALCHCIQAAIRSARAGMTTRTLDNAIEAAMLSKGAEPIMKGFRVGDRAFPSASSICVNEEATHGLPGERILRPGDLVSIDAALRLDGWCADAATSFVVNGGVGDEPGRRQRLVIAARDIIQQCTSAAQPGVWWSEIARLADSIAAKLDCRIVREYGGHGIGRELHEPPVAQLSPHIREMAGIRAGQPASSGQDFILRPGMVLTIEPVLTLGRAEVLGLDDGWTVVTRDREPACREERTIAITRRGGEVLTKFQD